MGAREQGVMFPETSDSYSLVFAGNCPRYTVIPAASDIGPNLREKSSSPITQRCHNLLLRLCIYFIQIMSKLMKIWSPSLETGPGTIGSFCSTYPSRLILHVWVARWMSWVKHEALHHYGVLYLRSDFIPHQEGHEKSHHYVCDLTWAPETGCTATVFCKAIAIFSATVFHKAIAIFG